MKTSRSGSRRRSIAVAAAAMAMWSLAACGDDAPTSAQAGGPGSIVIQGAGDAEAALVVCTVLRNQTNVMVDLANDAVSGLAADNPDERFDRLIDGFSSASSAVDEYDASLDDLALPDVPERRRLLDELEAGAESASAVVADRRTRFLDQYTTVADAELQGAIGYLFNTVEKVDAVVEPEIVRYERAELREAFLDEPVCDHVVQPFGVGG